MMATESFAIQAIKVMRFSVQVKWVLKNSKPSKTITKFGWKVMQAMESMGDNFLLDKQLSGPDRDIIMLAAPEMASLSNWIIAFVAAGGLAAALSTASGLLLVISSSIANDLYYRTLNPKASQKNQLLVGRVTIAVAVIIAGYFGLNPPGFVGQVVAF